MRSGRGMTGHNQRLAAGNNISEMHACNQSVAACTKQARRVLSRTSPVADCVSGSRREPLDRGGRRRVRGLPQVRAVHGATDASVRPRWHHSQRIERCGSSMCPSSTLGKRRSRSRELGTQIGRAPVKRGWRLSTPKVAIRIQVT